MPIGRAFYSLLSIQIDQDQESEIESRVFLFSFEYSYSVNDTVSINDVIPFYSLLSIPTSKKGAPM